MRVVLVPHSLLRSGIVTGPSAPWSLPRSQHPTRGITADRGGSAQLRWRQLENKFGNNIVSETSETGRGQFDNKGWSRQLIYINSIEEYVGIITPGTKKGVLGGWRGAKLAWWTIFTFFSLNWGFTLTKPEVTVKTRTKMVWWNLLSFLVKFAIQCINMAVRLFQIRWFGLIQIWIHEFF